MSRRRVSHALARLSSKPAALYICWHTFTIERWHPLSSASGYRSALSSDWQRVVSKATTPEGIMR